MTFYKIMLAFLWLLVGGLAAAGGVMLLPAHSAQARPTLSDLPEPGVPEPLRTEGNATLSYRETVKMCPSALQYRNLPAGDLPTWHIQVPEGDATRMAKLVAYDAIGMGGYAEIIESPYWQERVYVAYTEPWIRRLDDLNPWVYDRNEGLTDGYRRWAETAAARPGIAEAVPARSDGPCAWTPTGRAVFVISEQEVGWVSDANVKTSVYAVFAVAVVAAFIAAMLTLWFILEAWEQRAKERAIEEFDRS